MQPNPVVPCIKNTLNTRFGGPQEAEIATKEAQNEPQIAPKGPFGGTPRGPYFSKKCQKPCKYHDFWLETKNWLSWNGKRVRLESVQALQARREQREQQEQGEQESENHDKEQGESGEIPPTIETANA